MMLTINCENEGEGRNTKTLLSWEYRDKKIELLFSSIARYVLVEDKLQVFVSVFFNKKIYQYSSEGNLLSEFPIPEKEGYQYRGINRNLKAKYGVSLLFVPTEEGYGNQWGDVEQYDLDVPSRPLGKFLDIYR